MRSAVPSLIMLLAASSSARGEIPAGSPWKKHVINAQAGFEGAGVADFDGDGRPDVFSGDSWYQGPRWIRHQVRVVPRSPNPHYFEDFGDLPYDVNGDGRPDILTCSFFGKVIGWVENPLHPGDRWLEHEIDRPGSSEACRLADINGDGRLDLIPNPNNMVVWFELAARQPRVTWDREVVSREGVGHGVGLGDINGDGRIDFIGPHGWYEQPAELTDQPWPFHQEFELGVAGLFIWGRDVDGDGLTDVVWGMGHDYGLFWLRQSKGPDGTLRWERREIDREISQVHTLIWAELDGPGHPPVLITGKRVYAHETEPGATDAPGIFAYRYNRSSGRWKRQTLYQGTAPGHPPATAAARDAQRDFPPGTVGTGLDMVAADLDGDGDLDLVCPGKTGLYWLENPRRAPRHR